MEQTMTETSTGENSTVVDFALRTFAFGLFAKGAESDPGTPRGEHWECIAEPQEIVGRLGFTTLACGASDRCLGITPEGDVHCWDVGGRGLDALQKSFCMEWSLSVLNDEAGQRMQLRDVALGGWPARKAAEAVVAKATDRSLNVGAIALMDSGDVYIAEAQCSSSWRPVPDLLSQLVVSVSCGSGFCIALTARGELWAWGESACGALGLGNLEPSAAHESDAAVDLPQPISHAASPMLIRGELHGVRIAAVACGECHVIAATFDEVDEPGSVFSWGAGHDHRLGYSLEERRNSAGRNLSGLNNLVSEPREVSWITPELAEALLIRQLSNRDKSDRSIESCAVTYASGGDSEPSSPPRKRTASLRSPQRITQLGCGARHSVVLCQGSLICFGENDCGQLGRSDTSRDESCILGVELPPFASAPALLVPAKFKRQGSGMSRTASNGNTLNGQMIEATARRLCCGPLHTAAVSAEGHLHVWGIDLSTPGEKHCSDGVQLVEGFGLHRPVVTLTCGAHFVVATAEIELPPLRRSSTASENEIHGRRHAWRPANLPKKNEEETIKHHFMVRELERRMQRKKEQEEREEKQRRFREEQREEKQRRREQRLKEHTEIWMTTLLPAYVPGARPQRRIEECWRQGLPPRVREVLWPLAIGNVLRITPELFDIHSKQAMDARKIDEAAASNVLVTLAEPRRNHGRELSTKCIPFDLPRTFPTLAMFAEGGPLHQDCAKILEAYTFFRPDIGYVQGMSYLAAMLLLYLAPYPAFVGLCNLINTPSVLGLYRLEQRAVDCRALVFRRLCAAQLPSVARRLEEVGLTPELFLIEWFMTLYSKCLSIDVASVVWDQFFLDGEVVLYCTGIALFRIVEQQIMSGDGEDLEGCVRILHEELRERASDPDEVLLHIREVRRQAPSQLLAEIRDIERDEFSPSTTYQYTPSSQSAAVSGAVQAVSTAWRNLQSRWIG